jgi:hypothetical protein
MVERHHAALSPELALNAGDANKHLVDGLLYYQVQQSLFVNTVEINVLLFLYLIFFRSRTACPKRKSKRRSERQSFAKRAAKVPLIL